MSSIILLFSAFGYWILDEDNSLDIQTFFIDKTVAGITGESLADNLRFELKRIHTINERTHLTPANSVVMESDAPPATPANNQGHMLSGVQPFQRSLTQADIETLDPSPGSDQISKDLGTLGIEGMSVPLGKLLLALKELSGKTGNTIVGSFQRDGPVLIIVAVLKGHKRSMAWKVERTLSDKNSYSSEATSAMIEDLAFQIAQGTSSGAYPQTWQAFKYDILAKEAYNNYIITENISYLDKASNMTLKANTFEPSYPGSTYLIGNLAAAWTNIGNALYNQKKLNESGHAHDKAIEIQELKLKLI